MGETRFTIWARTVVVKQKTYLASVKGQAAELKKQRRLRWVTAVLCFTSTEIEPSILPEQPVEGVYVVKLSTLTWLLKRLDKLERRGVTRLSFPIN
jgi:hypothetical protein